MPVLAILNALTLAAQLLPEITALIPVVEKALRGDAATPEDLLELEAVTDDLNEKIAEAVEANDQA